MSGLVDNISASILGLKMPRAMEMLGHMYQRLDKGDIGTINALGVAAVKKGKSVHRTTLAELIEGLSKAEREGCLDEKVRL